MDGTQDGKAGAAVQRSAVRAWAIVAILFLVQVTNYWDKTVISLAATPIMAEFGLTPAQYGVISGAFFALYAVGGITVALLLAPRLAPRKIMVILLLTWSILQLPIAFAASYPIIVLCRLLLGFGEGAGTPTALNAAHEWFPNHDRNMPSAVVLLGATVGSLLAAPILTAVILDFGWRAAFLVCSALGVVILLLWVVVARSGPYAAATQDSNVAQEPVTRSSTRAVWTDRTIIGNFLVGFTAYWVVGFAVGWLAPFATRVLGDAREAAWAMSAIFALQASFVLIVPFVSGRLLKKGVSSRLARGWLTSGCMAGAGGALLLIPFVDNPLLVLGAMAVAIAFTAVVFPLSAAMISEVAPPDRRNSAVTIVFSLITISAVASSFGTGWLIGQPAYGWNAALTVHGIVGMLGALSGFLLIHPEHSMASLARRLGSTDAIAAKPGASGVVPA